MFIQSFFFYNGEVVPCIISSDLHITLIQCCVRALCAVINARCFWNPRNRIWPCSLQAC